MHYEVLLKLALLFHFTGYSFESKRSRRDVWNNYMVKNRATQKACEAGTCPAGECDNSKGWHLRGSDWGCCSNYEGCCQLASLICYTHDVICRCCDYGIFCGPLCKKDASCFAPSTPALPQLMMGDDGRRANEIPDPKRHVSVATNDKHGKVEERVNPKFTVGSVGRGSSKETDVKNDTMSEDGSGDI